MTGFQSQDYEDLKEHLDCALSSSRLETLRIFTKELMLALQKHNFTFDEFLDALSLYCEDFPEWSKVKEFIDDAVVLLQDQRREAELTSK